MNPVNQVIVIGAGPIGIAAAAHILARGLEPLVLEKGPSAGSAMLDWGHVRVFTPWSYVIDEAVEALLKQHGWAEPDRDHMPTGREIVEQYLQPASQTAELEPRITFNAEVIAIAKADHSKHTSTSRDEAKYTVHYKDSGGQTRVIYADAVIDASGTWSNPNPAGLDGLPVPGELENHDRIAYGIPDVANTERQRYEGKTTLVLGAGHSAMNIALDLLKLRESNPGTKVIWGLRKHNIDKLLGNGINDKVPARKELGIAATQAIDDGSLALLTGLKVKRITRKGNRLAVDIISDDKDRTIEVDKIVVATGFRPDLKMLRELRLDLDHIVEAPSKLAPMIDPNLHSCGSVPAHGVEQLSHFDKHFYMAGMKAYGRAPTFLMLTGYEQVRSIAAELAGDHQSARTNVIQYPQKTIETPAAEKAGCC